MGIENERSKIPNFRVPQNEKERAKFARAKLKIKKPNLIGGVAKCKSTQKLSVAPDSLPAVMQKPQLPFSLDTGFDASWEDDNVNPPPDEISQAVSLAGGDKKLDYGVFITYRNNLNKIFQAPYLQYAWRIHVRRLPSGAIRLEIVDWPEEEMNVRMRRFCYWGRQFETEVMGEIDSEYCAVINSQLGEHILLIGAEIDGVN